MVLSTSIGFFIASIGFLFLSLLLLILFLGLWTYKDAKVKSENSPLLWALIVVLVPNFLGFIIYLLVGRTKKEETAPGSFKIPLAVTAGIWVVSIVTVLIATLSLAFSDNPHNFFGTGFFMNYRSGMFLNLQDNSGDREWRVQLGSGNGFINTGRQLTESELASLSVVGISEQGNMSLRLQQNGLTKTIDITETLENIDTELFEPGGISMRLYFQQVRGGDLVISWNEGN
ncbi:MAG: PLD nuclease N-terminal domain-containing protein [Defluviitaleaceae bacterium]|nr:PLD nuclease N-terminal domain-containing protein [Defluviitaleaceae bacterium]